MITAQKEIIWHLTCNHCKYHWSYATMNDDYRINRGELHCPCCGKKCNVEIDKPL